MLSHNESITLDDIRSNLNCRWVWNSITINPNLTIDFINEFPNAIWDWCYISYGINSHGILI